MKSAALLSRFAVVFTLLLLFAPSAAAQSGKDGPRPLIDTATIPRDLMGQILSEKKRVPQAAVDGLIVDGFPATQTSTGTFLLMTEEALNRRSNLLPKSSVILDFATPYSAYINLDPSLRMSADLHTLNVALPRTPVDHKQAQTPVRYQGQRPTCVAFAALAGMESKIGVANLALSEEYAHHVFITNLGSSCCRQPSSSSAMADVNTIDAAGDLSSVDIPLDTNPPWAYNNRWPVCNGRRIGCDQPQHDTQPVPHPAYRLAAFDVIAGGGLSGASIRNTAYLEVLLASGYDVVIAMDKAWSDGAEVGIIDVVTSGGGIAVPPGGHAMLLVGYDRTAGYFEAKNSWGAGWGHSGYAWLSYAYLATYARYGFIVRSVATVP